MRARRNVIPLGDVEECHDSRPVTLEAGMKLNVKWNSQVPVRCSECATVTTPTPNNLQQGHEP